MDKDPKDYSEEVLPISILAKLNKPWLTSKMYLKNLKMIRFYNNKFKYGLENVMPN